jgi:pyruvate ferredoxin oxidoreductase alpha subunit
MKRTGMEGSVAIAEAVRLARAEVIASYPITPQTHIAETLADMVANGRLEAEYIPVESEHSAMSACLGSSAVGARTFTATAGQGLALMHEVLFVASSMRLPIVMAVANRALSGPLNVWGDQSDIMASRDCGWIQFFAENAQQAHDLVVCAFRIAEDNNVLFPVIVNVDGFNLSHVVEPVNLLTQVQVDGFLPPLNLPYALNPDKPLTLGAYAPPVLYSEARKSQDVALRGTKPAIYKVWKEFEKLTGRTYTAVSGYKYEDADTVLLMLGSFSETAKNAVNNLRKDGKKVGLITLHLWRPFPFDEVREILGKMKTVVVFDRAVSYGGPAPICSEIEAALYPLDKRPKIVSYVGGLGGRDVPVEQFEYIIKTGMERKGSSKSDIIETIGVRE